MPNDFNTAQKNLLTALESGEWPQVKGRLWQIVNGVMGFCCLGVATKQICPGSPDLKPGKDTETVSVGIVAPPEVVAALHLRNEVGGFHRDAPDLNGYDNLASANDNGATFADIAAYIRKYPWAVFTNFDAPGDAE